MHWLEAVVTVAKAWAWPIVALVAVILLRKDLGGLVRRVRQLQGLGVSADFGEAAAATEELAKTVEPNPPAELPVLPSEEWSRTSLKAEAIQHPTSAFFRAWLMVEETARQFGYNPKQEPLELFIRHLASQGLVPRLTASLAHQLMRLVNQVAHGEVIPEPDAAEAFVDAAWRLITTIRRVRTTKPGAWLVDGTD